MHLNLYLRLAAAASFAGAVSSQNSSSSYPTVNLFVDDAFDGKVGYAASVVTAYSDMTVYAIHCTSGADYISSSTCGPNAVVFTLTEGPSTYLLSTTSTAVVQGTTAVAAVSIGCALSGTTAASCVESVSLSVGGTSTKTTITSLLTGTDVHRFDVAITGGAEKTAAATGTAPVSGSGAMSLGGREGMTLAAVLAAGVVFAMAM